MLTVNERISDDAEPAATLTLPFELRQKSRLRARLDDGREVALLLPRGTVLRGGDRLRAADGLVIRLRARPEAVSTAFTKDPLLLARACYHLGNRHVPLEIGDSWLRYLHDHVLDALVAGMGLKVFAETAPFEPESGAYAPHGDGHGVFRSAAHAHAHDHGH
ncbi:MAG TPA: urease accessory protein UreE [Acidiferrobacterales bacterium]|jgi:urease accessory protein